MSKNIAGGIPNIDRETLIRECLPLAGARLLDIGCGEGWLAQIAAPEADAVIAIDPSTTALERAKAANRFDNIQFLAATAENMPIDDASVNVAVYYNSLHHVPGEVQPAALAETARGLEPGGVLCIIEPMASGACYELFRPAEDESEVYAATYELIRALENGADYRAESESFFIDDFIFADLEQFLDHVLVVDERREQVVLEVVDQLRERFENLGETVEGGKSFDQMHRLNLFHRL